MVVLPQKLTDDIIKIHNQSGTELISLCKECHKKIHSKK